MVKTYEDSICVCIHWFEEHEGEGECGSPGCPCIKFIADRELNTPELIADRGGLPHRQPCNCNACRLLRNEPLREF